MSATTTPILSGLTSNIVKETASGATPDNDVRNGASTLYCVVVDNTANSAATFTKFYDAASPTVGTTAPDYIFKTPASTKREYWLSSSGVAFATGISFASVTAGGTAGTTSPVSSTVVSLFTS